MSPHKVLAVELGLMLEAGRWPRCCAEGHRGGWLSDDHAERARAAELCVGCPILAPCRAVGELEVFGVWAGQDRTPRAKGRRQP